MWMQKPEIGHVEIDVVRRKEKNSEPIQRKYGMVIKCAKVNKEYTEEVKIWAPLCHSISVSFSVSMYL